MRLHATRWIWRGSLLSEWLPALDGVVEQLHAGIAVADVGCGHGHSTMLMARAFPESRFHGFDTHAASTDEARRTAADAGLAAPVGFDVARAVDYPGQGYGLVCFFDCLHDLGDPNIFTPLAMTTATYDYRPLMGSPGLAIPYTRSRLGWLSAIPRGYQTSFELAGNIFTTIEDMAQVIKLQFRTGPAGALYWGIRRMFESLLADPRHAAAADALGERLGY